MKRTSAITAATAIGCLSAVLSGCVGMEDRYEAYTQRSLTVSPGAGDAVDANTAIQTVDPWPPHVGDTRIPGDGARMVSAVEAYETGKAKAAAPPPPAAPAASGSASSPPPQ